MTKIKLAAFKLIHLALIAALAGAAVAAAASATGQDMYKGYELPPYEVIEGQGDIELRRYAPHILAEVEVQGSQSKAISRGFQMLANYIFGGNEAGQKIAMTVPVGQVPQAPQAPEARMAESWTVSFMMPARFNRDTLPRAKSSAITFVTTEAETLLVVGFKGFRNERALASKTDTLLAEAERRGLTQTGAPRYFFYDGPMTPPWARRNEVAIPVTGIKTAQSS
ncbi:MAG: heme-binding protein [Pseudomonadota bacterium]